MISDELLVYVQLRPRRRQVGPAGHLEPPSFQCKYCRNHVLTHPAVSGVANRNHCPYCLWSRHLDLARAGDRLSACKGGMRPVGLTLKRTRSKYGQEKRGELMLVHQCVECGKVSINRIASDDRAEELVEVYRRLDDLTAQDLTLYLETGIDLLGEQDQVVVMARLFGKTA